MNAVRIRILPITKDLRDAQGRSAAAYLEQERADHKLEAMWRNRVAENVRRRIADGRYNPRNV